MRQGTSHSERGDLIKRVIITINRADRLPLRQRTGDLPHRNPAILAQCIAAIDLRRMILYNGRVLAHLVTHLVTHLITKEIRLWPMVQPIAHL